jgi:hypothetical protein
VSAQGLTYPHDFVLSRIGLRLLRRVISQTAGTAKLLILLATPPCRESGQGGAKQAGTSVSGRVGMLTHKVFHSRGGEFQKPPKIIGLRAEYEERLRIIQNAPGTAHG